MTATHPTTPDQPEFADLLAEAYGPLTLLAAGLIGDRVEAEDLVQEAALVGLDKYAQFKPGTSFYAWMGRIVRFHASNWRSKRARRRTQATDPGDIDRAHPGSDITGEADVAASAAGSLGGMAEGFDDAVVEALQTLAPAPRACLLLRAVHDLSYEQIAEMLGVPAGTAMSHVHRSRAKLRHHLAGAAGTNKTAP